LKVNTFFMSLMMMMMIVMIVMMIIMRKVFRDLGDNCLFVCSFDELF
jgi:hypothetical protein